MFYVKVKIRFICFDFKTLSKLYFTLIIKYSDFYPWYIKEQLSRNIVE